MLTECRNPDNSACPDGCFRPVGLAWDSNGRLFMSSDATGEIYMIIRSDGTPTSGDLPSAVVQRAESSASASISSAVSSASASMAATATSSGGGGSASGTSASEGAASSTGAAGHLLPTLGPEVILGLTFGMNALAWL
jgi:hypothetical protein